MFSPFESEEDKETATERKEYFRLMKSQNAYEKKAFTLRIRKLETYLEDRWKLYRLTRESDYAMRSMILREIVLVYLWQCLRININYGSSIG
jgi:hypothetical protein